MKATFTFKQIGHLVLLVEQKGVTSGDQLQDHIDAGPLADVFEIPDPKKITLEMRDAARRAYGLPPLRPPLLEALGIIAIAATSEFVVSERFVVGDKYRYISGNFKACFYDKTEKQAARTKLRYAKLTRAALDDEIRKEIGAELEETTLVEIDKLTERQKNGEPGVLLTNGANIFYVRDATGTLHAVYVYWSGEGWNVNADSVARPYRWCGGHRVFSRDSSVAVIA